MSALQQEIPIGALVLCYSDAQDACSLVLDALFKIVNLSFMKLWKKVLEDEFLEYKDFNDVSKCKAGLSAVQSECTVSASEFLPSDSTLQDLRMYFNLELPTKALVCNWTDDGDRITSVNTISIPARSAHSSVLPKRSSVACNLYHTPASPAATAPPPVTLDPSVPSKLAVFLLSH